MTLFWPHVTMLVFEDYFKFPKSLVCIYVKVTKLRVHVGQV